MQNKYVFTSGHTQYEIPEYMRESLENYIDDGVPVGSFLRAVLGNNLIQAVGNADENNLANLPAYANFLYNHAPSACWGSPEKVKAWKGVNHEKT